jgi:PadR family transcriptional regulator, regulatory protein PadR
MHSNMRYIIPIPFLKEVRVLIESLHNSDLIRGNIDTFILRVLSDGDNYGYQIIKEISIRSGKRFELKEPTLYSSLRRLEKQGLIRSYWGEETQGGRRKYYNLSQEGQGRLLQNQEEWKTAREIIDVLIGNGKELTEQ